MPEENNNQVDHNRNIALLAQDYGLDKNYEDYRKKLKDGERDLEGSLGPINNVLTRGDQSLENLLRNATPQAIEHEIGNYHERHKEELDRAVNETGDSLAEQYVSGLNNLINRIIEEVSKQEGFKELSEKDRLAKLGPMIYINLVEALKDLEAKKEEVMKAQKEFYGLDKATDAEAYEAVNSYLTEDMGLSSNAINLVERGRVYRESVVPRKKAMLSRFIVSKLLKEKDGGYAIDVNKFKEIYGTSENYKKLAYDFVERTREAARQRSQEQATNSEAA